MNLINPEWIQLSIKKSNLVIYICFFQNLLLDLSLYLRWYSSKFEICQRQITYRIITDFLNYLLKYTKKFITRLKFAIRINIEICWSSI